MDNDTIDAPIVGGYESLMDRNDMEEDVVVDAYVVDDDEEDVEEENHYAAGSSSKRGENNQQDDDQRQMKQNQEAILIGLGFTSFVFLIQTGYDCDETLNGIRECKDKLAFGVATATISLCVVLAHFIALHAPQIKDHCECWKIYVEPSIMFGLWNLWGIAAITLTFPDHSYHEFSYVFLGTGWLMIWSSVALTTIALYPMFHPVWKNVKRSMPICEAIGAPDGQNVILLVAIMLCALTVMWAAADKCDELNGSHTSCKDEVAWAVVCSLFSLIYSLVLLLFGKCIQVNKMLFKIMSIVHFLWWFCGMAVCTVAKPFVSSNDANGFFGIWMALAFSALVMLKNLEIELNIGE